MIKAKAKFGKLEDAFVSIPDNHEPGVLEIHGYTYEASAVEVEVGVSFVLSHERAEHLARAILDHIVRYEGRKAKRKS